MFVVSNIKDAYSGAWAQIQDSKPAFERVITWKDPTDEDLYRVGSVTFKVIGTLGLASATVIAIRALIGTSSFYKIFFAAIPFVAGHDALRTGDNLHKHFVTKEKTGFAAGFGKLSSMLSGSPNKSRQKRRLALGYSEKLYGGTIIAKFVADIVTHKDSRRMR